MYYRFPLVRLSYTWATTPVTQRSRSTYQTHDTPHTASAHFSWEDCMKSPSFVTGFSQDKARVCTYFNITAVLLGQNSGSNATLLLARCHRLSNHCSAAPRNKEEEASTASTTSTPTPPSVTLVDDDEKEESPPCPPSSLRRRSFSE